jgi:large subunit ribosomal protein L29
MKAKELREMSVEELKAKLEELRKEYLNLRFQKALGQSDRPYNFKRIRQDIARILTVLREKGVKI